MRHRHVILLPLLGGCPSPDEVQVSGVVQRSSEDERGLGAGNILIRDEDGEVFREESLRSDGFFRVRAPAGQTIFAEISGPTTVTTSFTGVSGLESRLQVPDGTLFGMPESEIQAWRDRFEGCPGADQSGPMVMGEVRVLELQDADGEHPLVTSASVRVVLEDETTLEACYLDEEGLAWEPNAERTGEAGAFAIFDVPDGLQLLEVDFEVGQEVTSSWYDIWVPDDPEGAVPRLPVWVEFPF